MFEFPKTKRVKREDLRDRSSSPSEASSPQGTDSVTYTEALKHRYGEAVHIPIAETVDANAASTVEDDAEATSLEFRLFSGRAKHASSTPVKEQTSVARINIRSPTPTAGGGGGFVNPHRPRSYYFTPSIDGCEKRQEYQVAAIDGRDLCLRAKSTNWPGMHLPFRLIKLPPSSSVAPALKLGDSSTSAHVQRRRSRPGKKRRIAMRKRATVQSAKIEEERMKKTQKNSRKKAKKRERDKARKRAAADPVDEGVI
ncbi:MAG: hypothetical protein Q9227_002031 [Pyrenula ochraceoflavens]